MQGEQTLEVWCLVGLHHLPALVRVTSKSADIDHFKEAIKEKFDLSVSTSRLVLWKVRIFCQQA
jgi:spore maturation protein CgeB